MELENLLKQYSDESILNEIFEKREEQLYTEISKDRKNKKRTDKEKVITYEMLITMIKNIPPHFKNTRENILKCLDEYCDQENLLSSFDNENFYKYGFCDGVKLIIEILTKTKHINTSKIL